jgi:hypothetical protein
MRGRLLAAAAVVGLFAPLAGCGAQKAAAATTSPAWCCHDHDRGHDRDRHHDVDRDRHHDRDRECEWSWDWDRCER